MTASPTERGFALQLRRQAENLKELLPQHEWLADELRRIADELDPPTRLFDGGGR